MKKKRLMQLFLHAREVWPDPLDQLINFPDGYPELNEFLAKFAELRRNSQKKLNKQKKQKRARTK